MACQKGFLKEQIKSGADKDALVEACCDRLSGIALMDCKMNTHIMIMTIMSEEAYQNINQAYTNNFGQITEQQTASITNTLIDIGKISLSRGVIESNMGDKSQSSLTIKSLNELTSGSPLKALYEPMFKLLSEQANLYKQINTSTGLRGELSNKLNEDFLEASVNAKLYGIELKDIGEYYTELVDKTGKLALTNKNNIEDIMPLASSLNLTMKEYADIQNKMVNIGFGSETFKSNLNNTLKNTLSVGLSANKVVKTISENVNLLNEYNFKNGYDGLEKMVKKTIELRMEMKSITGFAEKIMDTDKAIETVANLQMIGGAIGDLNNPLKLMYLANNNIEELPNLIENAAKSLVTYDDVQGRFNITGINLRRARDMADAFGMSLNELKTTAIAATERVQASTSLMGSGLIFKNDEEKELLINMSKMSKGQSIITVPVSLKKEFGDKTDVALESLSNKQKDLLVSYQDSVKNMDIKDIALGQYNKLTELVNKIDAVLQKTTLTGVKLITPLMNNELTPSLNNLSGQIKTLGEEISKFTPQQAEKIYKQAKESFNQYTKDALEKIKNSDLFKTPIQQPAPIQNSPPSTPPSTPSGPPIKLGNNYRKIDVNINLSGNNQNLIAAFQREVDKDPASMMKMIFSDSREMTS